MELKISFVNKAVIGSAYGTDVSHKVKVPEPKSFGATQSAKELEIFLLEMEQFFKGSHIFG